MNNTSFKVYLIDAMKSGNVGRYLNHSCDPNVYVQNVFHQTHDLRFPMVAFFTCRYYFFIAFKSNGEDRFQTFCHQMSKTLHCIK